MDVSPHNDGNLPDLTYGKVGIGFACILADAALSRSLDIGVEIALIVGATRCIVQLSIMGMLLESAFENDNPAGVVGIAVLLILLGCVETVVNQSRLRVTHMFPCVFLSFICSTIPLSLIGSQWAIGNKPFWTASQYIPMMGMLTGNAITAIVIATSTTLKEISRHQDETEVMLAYGASRFEACKPIAQQAIRLSILPVVNQMSILGIISIPGLMTGAILGGSSVDQAAKLQMIMMFLITSSTTLSSIIATFVTLGIVIDEDHRIRCDKIDQRRHYIWRCASAACRWSWDRLLYAKDYALAARVSDGDESYVLLGEQVELKAI